MISSLLGSGGTEDGTWTRGIRVDEGVHECGSEGSVKRRMTLRSGGKLTRGLTEFVSAVFESLR
jgi:hypothetical protein